MCTCVTHYHKVEKPLYHNVRVSARALYMYLAENKQLMIVAYE